MIRCFVRLLVVLGLLVFPAASLATVLGSSHDLSGGHGRSGNGAETGSQVCVYCHVPHVAETGSGRLAGYGTRVQAGFHPFDDGRSDPPGGEGISIAPRGRSITNLCLSCHDGAVSSVRVMISVPPGDPAGRATDARMGVADEPAGDDGAVGTVTMRHPVDFVYPGGGEGANAAFPPVGGPLVAIQGGVYPLDRNGRMQCSTCHDPHGAWAGRVRSSWRDEGIISEGFPSSEGMCRDCHRDAARP